MLARLPQCAECVVTDRPETQCHRLITVGGNLIALHGTSAAVLTRLVSFFFRSLMWPNSLTAG